MIRLFRRRPPMRPAPFSRRGGWYWLTRLCRRALLLGLLLLLLPVGAIVAFRWLPVPCSSFMLIRQVERLLQGSDVPPIRHQWVDLHDMSPMMPLAVIAGEDQRFPGHWGFDFHAISQALDYNSKQTRKVRGGSTISQQTAKNLFLWGGRSFLRKGLEAWLTLCLELCWSKERIVEIYLNIAEFGDGIYGVQAASTYLLKTQPARLSRHQAALMAAVLPSPRRFHAERPSAYVLGRARWIETNMIRLGGTRYLDQL